MSGSYAPVVLMPVVYGSLGFLSYDTGLGNKNIFPKHSLLVVDGGQTDTTKAWAMPCLAA